jgi:hypothetical protein
LYELLKPVLEKSRFFKMAGLLWKKKINLKNFW